MSGPGWSHKGKTYDSPQEVIEALELQNDRYRKALEIIADDQPRYPDGDAMSMELCAKIALGKACPECGNDIPCAHHKERQTEKPKCDMSGPCEEGRFICRLCGTPFFEVTAYPHQFTLCEPCDFTKTTAQKSQGQTGAKE